MVTSDSASTGRFYGWYVVGALFFATFLVVGTRQGFGVFVETWEEEWGVSVGAISIAASVGWLLNGLVQPFFGRVIDRIGGRPVVLASMAVMGLAFIAMAFATNVWMLTVLYGFVISSAAGGLSPSMTGVFVVRWFQRKRGTAMSLLVSGGSVGWAVAGAIHDLPLPRHELANGLDSGRHDFAAAGAAVAVVDCPQRPRGHGTAPGR